MLVCDANILISAVLGIRVWQLLIRYQETTKFVAPASAFEEARRRLPEILARRKAATLPGNAMLLSKVAKLIRSVPPGDYLVKESDARLRMARRDPDDWPILATALTLDTPIWTEDLDFFGCGVATWTTDRVEIHLAKAAVATSSA